LCSPKKHIRAGEEYAVIVTVGYTNAFVLMNVSR
jgi:hypothetical protein